MSKRPWLGLFAVLAAILMNLLDSTIVNVAAPAIRADLGGSYTDLQWVVAGYTLALAIGLLTGGRLGDMFGRKRMIMIGIAGFLAASILCALAPTMPVLIVARVLQGLIGAIMIPQGFGLIRDLFSPQQMGKAFAALGPVIGLSTIAGPIAAGLLVDADLFGTGWRMIFLINLPLAGFALAAGQIALPAATTAQVENRPKRLDMPGMALAAVGMFLLVFPLVQGQELGWPAWTLLMLAAAVPVIGTFAAHQLRLRRRGRTPLVELSVFTRRSYTSGVLFVVVFFGAVVGFSLAVGLFLQLGLGYTPTRASLTMAAWALGAFLGSGFSAGAMVKLGRRILHLGLSLMAVGGAALYVVLDNVGPAIGTWHLAAPLLIFGIGMGMIFVPLFDIIMGEIGDREVGSASGLLESIQQAGASLGVAALGTVFFSVAGPTTGHGVLDPAGSVNAASVVTLLTLVLTAVSFGLGFLLPRRARAHAAPETPTADQAAPAPAADLALAAA